MSIEIPDIRRLYKWLMLFKSSNQEWLGGLSETSANTRVALQLIMFESSCLLSNINRL